MRGNLALVFCLYATSALATMPLLSEQPSEKSAPACEQWAKAQDDDALEMWGVQDSGRASREVGLNRLKNFCMSGEKSEIVGFGSSAGFDAAYCRKHKTSRLCR